MRRVGLESVVVGVVAGGLALLWFGLPMGNVVCGPDAAVLAWRLSHLQAFAEGRAALGVDGDVAVPLAGWAWSGLGVVLAAGVGVATACKALVMLAVGAGAAALWGLSRAAGGGVPAAGLATAVGTIPVVAAGGLAAGGVDLAVVPFVAVALVALPRPERGARALGVAAVLACAACDARTGAILGVAAAAAGGGGWALLAALVATGTGAAASASAGVLDPVDLLVPFVTLRPGALAPGLAALAGALWVIGDRGLRRAAAVGFVCALGPLLSAFADPLTIGGAAIPLPSAVLAVFVPAGEGWAGGLVVAAVAVALGLGRLSQPRVALLLAPLALVEARAAAVPEPSAPGVAGECLSLDVPVAVRALGEREGSVLNLPVAAVAAGRAVGGPGGVHALYLFQRAQHGRPLATGVAPLGAADPLYGEPGVVLSLDPSVGGGGWLLPPTRPGEVLRGLGVTEIVVHRALLAPQALARIDPVFYKLYGAPQRDHAGNVDLYRVPAAGPTRPPTPETLHPLADAAPTGWLGVAEYLAGLDPVGVAGAGDPMPAAGPGEARPGEARPTEARPAEDRPPDARPSGDRRAPPRGRGRGAPERAPR